MVIIGRMYYPTESTQEMAKRFLEAPQVPGFMSRKGPYVGSDLAEGISIVAFYELDNAKLAEGLDFVGNYYAMYFGVPGFKYEIQPYFEVAEALKMIGIG